MHHVILLSATEELPFSMMKCGYVKTRSFMLLLYGERLKVTRIHTFFFCV